MQPSGFQAFGPAVRFDGAPAGRLDDLEVPPASAEVAIRRGSAKKEVDFERTRDVRGTPPPHHADARDASKDAGRGSCTASRRAARSMAATSAWQSSVKAAHRRSTARFASWAARSEE